MKAYITCKNKEHGKLYFYLVADGSEHYLFSYHYNKKTQRYYENGVTVEKALNKTNSEVLNIIADKLPGYIRYIEKEYDIAILKSTKKKGNDAKVRRDKVRKLRERDFEERLVA